MAPREPYPGWRGEISKSEFGFKRAEKFNQGARPRATASSPLMEVLRRSLGVGQKGG
jgi:hypothetical protein